MDKVLSDITVLLLGFGSSRILWIQEDFQISQILKLFEATTGKVMKIGRKAVMANPPPT